ncbi:MAG: anaerobic ribonucleoside-triphosphate reductase activating protein [Ruminococcaceae bacterium]|nr:anaerobic ribonucleoside-triphosphate reductase activating protein [Oscillospiraceae bacterium]
MNFCNIKYFDIANGEGVRTTLFVSGCTNHCENCFQPETWDFAYGEEFTEETERQIIDSLAPYYVNGLTLLGGEPFEPKNQPRLLELLKKVRAEHPEKDVWCFTGFTLDGELLKDGSYPRCDVTDEMLSLIDVLVDGRYVEALKDISLRFRGSSNQRIIDMNKTREAGEIVLWNEKQL